MPHKAPSVAFAALSHLPEQDLLRRVSEGLRYRLEQLVAFGWPPWPEGFD